VPVFLLLARVGLLGWLADHQRVVQTFVTNLRGPEGPLTFGGAAVRVIIPIPSTTGNVTVTFTASSYAGTLYITVLSDPGGMTDAPRPGRRPPPRASSPGPRSPPRRPFGTDLGHPRGARLDSSAEQLQGSFPCEQQ
jgi:uncharacterized protein DUF1298